MKEKLAVHDLLSIDIYFDTDDEDEEMRWFPLFVNTPKGVVCQFSDYGGIDSESILRIRVNSNKETK